MRTQTYEVSIRESGLVAALIEREESRQHHDHQPLPPHIELSLLGDDS
jgi:hypothetical protein